MDVRVLKYSPALENLTTCFNDPCLLSNRVLLEFGIDSFNSILGAPIGIGILVCLNKTTILS